MKLLAVRVGLPDDAAITVKIRYGDDGEEGGMKGGGVNCTTLCTAGPTDTIIVIKPPPAHPPAPIICYCDHADCADICPSFSKIVDLENTI